MRGHKVGLWGAGSVVHLALSGGHVVEYICKGSLRHFICVLSHMYVKP